MTAIRHPPLWEIWEYLGKNPRLGDIAEIHRGIEWNIPFEKNLELLVSSVPRSGFKKGIVKDHGNFECYYAHDFVYLNVEDRFCLTQIRSIPWDKSKIIANNRSLSLGPWKMAGFLDEQRLFYPYTLLGIWSKKETDIFYLSALINNIVLNAFLSYKEYGRGDIVRVLNNVPVPIYETDEVNRVTSLIKKYLTLRKSLGKASPVIRGNLANEFCRIIVEIDSLVLKAYDLPPRMERKLLDFFRGYPRPVPFSFPDYFPADFKPWIPLHQYLAMDMKQVSAGKILKRIKPIDSEVIHEFVLDLEEGQA